MIEDISAIRLNEAEIDYTWSRIEPMITRALELTNGELVSSDIKLLADKGYANIWVVYEKEKIWAVCITEPIQLPHFRVLRILVLAGEHFELWKHFDSWLEGQARALGCDYIDAFTRPGIPRVVKDLGYKHQYSVIRKAIDRRTH